MLDIPLMSNNISQSDIDVLIQFLQTTGRFTNGPKVREFEEAWSEWLGVKFFVCKFWVICKFYVPCRNPGALRGW